MKGRIHSVESFGSVDGPGIRFIVFLQGCGFRCKFCHNPDAWHESKLEQAQWIEAEDLLKQALKYKSYWKDNGGITVCGGEPLLQMDFLIDFFKKAKVKGIHTTIDTAGGPFQKKEPFYSKFEELMRLTDLVLLDLKVMDTEAHRELTGQTNENILEMARELSDRGIPMWIRHVLVPGVTDDPEDLKQMADFIDTLDTVEKVEILPYHTLGVFKYKELGIAYPLENVNPPTEQEIKKAEDILLKRNKQ